MVSCLLAGLLALAAPVAARTSSAAASGGPSAGTWGAEARVGRFNDATVRRFLSPSWAVLVGSSLESTNTAGTGSARVPGRTDFASKAGIRKYQGTGLGLRSITGAGITLGRIEGFSSTWTACGEAGATNLFTRHLSLGAAGVVTVTRDGDKNRFGLVVPRVFAGIFF